MCPTHSMLRPDLAHLPHHQGVSIGAMGTAMQHKAAAIYAAACHAWSCHVNITNQVSLCATDQLDQL